MTDAGVNRLMGAILAQAVKDYKALISNKKKPSADCNIHELEKFFRSEWFNEMVDYKIDGEYVMRECRKQVKNGK